MRAKERVQSNVWLKSELELLPRWQIIVHQERVFGTTEKSIGCFHRFEFDSSESICFSLQPVIYVSFGGSRDALRRVGKGKFTRITLLLSKKMPRWANTANKYKNKNAECTNTAVGITLTFEATALCDVVQFTFYHKMQPEWREWIGTNFNTICLEKSYEFLNTVDTVICLIKYWRASIVKRGKKTFEKWRNHYVIIV